MIKYYPMVELVNDDESIERLHTCDAAISMETALKQFAVWNDIYGGDRIISRWIDLVDTDDETGKPFAMVNVREVLKYEVNSIIKIKEL